MTQRNHPQQLAGLLLALLTFALSSHAADRPPLPDPTLPDIAYGPHERNVLDFWKSKNTDPAPLLLVIHGGGFHEGEKLGFARHHREGIMKCMDAGMAVASINYRYIMHAPLADIFQDAARALQYLRLHAAELGIDKTKVVAVGESAGSGLSLWLATHDEMADPGNPDPLLRESTRISAVAALVPQATYDFTAWPDVLGVSDVVWISSAWSISGAYYHCSPIGVYTEKGRTMRANLDIRSLITADDPPIAIHCYVPDVDLTIGNGMRWLYEETLRNGVIPALGKLEKPRLRFDILHHPSHTRALVQACERQGVEYAVNYDDTPNEEKVDVYGFLIQHVK